jgi:hypothetical protein
MALGRVGTTAPEGQQYERPVRQPDLYRIRVSDWPTNGGEYVRLVATAA